MEIIRQLQEIGLEGRKSQVYLAVLKLTQSTPNQIAKEAAVERTTVYKILQELAQVDLVTKIVHGKRLQFRANPVANLKSYLDKKISLVEEITPALAALQGAQAARPSVKYYDTVDGIRGVLMESLDCQEKVRRDYALVDNVVEFLGTRFINHQIEERVKRKVSVLSLRRRPVKTEQDWYLKKDNSRVLREVRYLPSSAQVEPLVMIYDSTVAIVSSKRESYALVIESKEFSQAQKTLFDIAWQSADKE